MKPQFFIMDGVRRAVATREAGLPDIPARIIEPGNPDLIVRLSLDQLHSPKQAIPYDFRYIRYVEYPTVVLKTEPPPIDVEVLGKVGQGPSVPLSQVALR